MRRRDLLGAAAGAVIATVLAGGVAWAAIPSQGGTINGCYQKVEGQLRVIDARSDTCRPSELPIAWNEQGVPGPKGDKGDAGKDGADGHDGTSVTVTPDAPGANCPAGGVKITGANGAAYVCNAIPPDPGADG
jgi:hypothetical protein